MEKQNTMSKILDEVFASFREYDNQQYQLFKRIGIMSTDELESLSCKFEVNYDRSCPKMLRLNVPVHLPDINALTGMGTAKTYAEMFGFYWTIWNSVFTKTFFHGWASGVLADFRSILDPFVVIKLCSPSVFPCDHSLRLLFMALIANVIIRRSGSFTYAIEYEQTEGEIGHTVIEVREEKPALVTDVSVITLGEDDLALITGM